MAKDKKKVTGARSGWQPEDTDSWVKSVIERIFGKGAFQTLRPTNFGARAGVAGWQPPVFQSGTLDNRGNYIAQQPTQPANGWNQMANTMQAGPGWNQVANTMPPYVGAGRGMMLPTEAEKYAYYQKLQEQGTGPGWQQGGFDATQWANMTYNYTPWGEWTGEGIDYGWSPLNLRLGAESYAKTGIADPGSLNRYGQPAGTIAPYLRGGAKQSPASLRSVGTMVNGQYVATGLPAGETQTNANRSVRTFMRNSKRKKAKERRAAYEGDTNKGYGVEGAAGGTLTGWRM